MRNKYKVFGFGLALAVFGACSSGGEGGGCSSNGYLSNSEIVGSWVMTSGSLEMLSREKGSFAPGGQLVFSFNGDGTLGDRTFITDGLSGKVCEGRGEWVLEHDTYGYSNRKKKDALKVRLTTGEIRKEYYLSFRKVNDTLRIWEYYSDPDQMSLIEYEKMAATAQQPSSGPPPSENPK